MISGHSEKPAVVLIHAFYATAASWYQNLKILSDNFRVYTVDIIGDPNKSKPTKLIRKLNDFVDWFNDLLDGLGLEEANFIGNSVGAFHIANFALHSPKRVRKMILMGLPLYLNRLCHFTLIPFQEELPVGHFL
jgi:pimeloyl-ACP methyl ester carboxylesterase